MILATYILCFSTLPCYCSTNFIHRLKRQIFCLWPLNMEHRSPRQNHQIALIWSTLVSWFQKLLHTSVAPAFLLIQFERSEVFRYFLLSIKSVLQSILKLQNHDIIIFIFWNSEHFILSFIYICKGYHSMNKLWYSDILYSNKTWSG